MPHTLKFPSSLLQRLTSLRGLALFSVGCCALLSQDSATAQDTKEPKKVTAIYVVAKTHFDLGFTDQAENVFHRYRVEMMNSALKVMEATATLPKDQQFAWTVPGWPIAAQMLGPKQDPARKARIEQVLRNGLLVMHALPFTAHTESLELEDLVRGLDFSRAIARKYGLPLPLAAKMTDVPSHSWVLPTLLSHAGVRFLHLGCNPASQTPRVPALFWWEGPDGSRILCGYTADYGSGLKPPKGWPSVNYLAMMMTGDNHGPPSATDVEKWRETCAKTMPDVNVHFGTLDDFAKAVIAENPKLMVVRGDMPDTWIHGLMSMPQATRVARNMRPLAPALEILDTQLRLWGLSPVPATKTLAKVYENSLLFAEHTWGMSAGFGPRELYGAAWKKWLADMEQEPLPANGDYSKLPRGSKRKWMQSYQDHRDYANTADKLVRDGLQESLALLADNVTAKPGDNVVYNPLPWTRSGIVEMGEKTFFARDVPACGYKVFPATAASTASAVSPAASSASSLETPHFKVEWDLKRGGIASLIEKATGREWVDKSSAYVIGQFLHERFSSNEVARFFKVYARLQKGWGLSDFGKHGMPNAEQVPYMATTPEGWQITVAHSPVADSATLVANDPQGLAKGYRLTFSFPRHSASVEIEWKVAQKTAEKQPEGGWLCFPFAVKDPRFTVGRLGAPIDPAKDIIPGTNRHLYAVNTGVAIRGSDTAGIGLCPLDSPLVSLAKPGLWYWDMAFVPAKPSVFVNLYNNMWNTNFPLWQDGSWSERVCFWPMAEHATPVSDLTVKAWEARLPLQVFRATGKGRLPAKQTGVSVSRAGVLVTSFGVHLNTPGTVLRVWEQVGMSGELTVLLPGAFKTATPINLRGEKTGAAFAVTNGKCTFNLPAYAPASFMLE